MTPHKFTITAARGMLPLLAKELTAMGISDTKEEQGIFVLPVIWNKLIAFAYGRALLSVS